MTIHIKEHLNLLGTQMKDVVTGFKGMVESISFDTYGCVQAVLSPQLDKDGKIQDARWFDVKRLKPDGKRLMAIPPFVAPGQENGPADKPAFAPRSLPK